jgi:hypothetical protein
MAEKLFPNGKHDERIDICSFPSCHVLGFFVKAIQLLLSISSHTLKFSNLYRHFDTSLNI